VLPVLQLHHAVLPIYYNRCLFASQAEDTQTYNTQQYTDDENDDK